jgi:hypothetical protein
MTLTRDTTITIDDHDYRLIDEQAFLSMRSALRQIAAGKVLFMGLSVPNHVLTCRDLQDVANTALFMLDESESDIN